MSKVARMHMDNTQDGAPLRMALCGWPTNSTALHVDQVDCKSCLTLLRRMARREAASDDGSRSRLAAAFAASSIPSASQPPVLTASVWASTCKGGEPRCQACVLCAWEIDVARWANVSAWNEGPKTSRSPTQWPSANAALAALCGWELHGRVAPSACGGILACIERGYMESCQTARATDPLQRRAGDLVRVRQSLDIAYPHDFWSPTQYGTTFTRWQSIAVLFARTPGAFPDLLPYEAIAARMECTPGVLQAIVKRGRSVVAIELAARGLIPDPPIKARLFEQIAQLRERLAAHV